MAVLNDSWLMWSQLPTGKINEAKTLLEEGWLTMKQFVAQEAQSRGVSSGSIYTRLWRGLYPNLKVKRFNPRVILVKRNEQTTIHQRRANTQRD